MIWDHLAGVYDIFEIAYNGGVIREMCKTVTGLIGPEDEVLECACGTGLLTVGIGAKCARLTVTDDSVKMLRKAVKKCAQYETVQFRRASILDLPYQDASFDKVVAGNVIHLLDEPDKALSEMMRVCRPGGKLIIPTYVSHEGRTRTGWAVRFLKALGVEFRQLFDAASYRAFFRRRGYENAAFFLVEGRMPNMIAVISKE